MSQPPKPCSKCQGPMDAVELAPFTGEHGGVTVTVRQMPAVQCPQGHRRFLYPAFAALLMDLVKEPQQYGRAAEAVKKGLFKKHYHCAACDRELPADAAGTKSLELTATLKHADPFSVAVEVPVHRCACGQESVRARGEVADLAFKAIGHAYRAVDIHP